MANAAFLRAPSVSPDDCRSAVTALQQTPPEGVTKREGQHHVMQVVFLKTTYNVSFFMYCCYKVITPLLKRSDINTYVKGHLLPLTASISSDAFLCEW